MKAVQPSGWLESLLARKLAEQTAHGLNGMTAGKIIYRSIQAR